MNTRRIAMGAAILLLVGASANSQKQEHPDWMIGTWTTTRHTSVTATSDSSESMMTWGEITAISDLGESSDNVAFEYRGNGLVYRSDGEPARTWWVEMRNSHPVLVNIVNLDDSRILTEELIFSHTDEYIWSLLLAPALVPNHVSASIMVYRRVE